MQCHSQSRYSVMATYHGNIPARGSLYSSPVISPRQSTTSPPLEQVSSQPLSFSISRILGIEDNITQTRLNSEYDNSFSDQNQGGCTDKSLQRTDHSPNVDSDNPSTDSGRDSDADRSTPRSSERPRKKKQRTTFSPIEVCELEKVFAERPYLTPEDEDELVRKLGLTTRNIRFWFQNRRAKSRRQERSSASISQTSLINQFNQYQPAPRSQLQFRHPAHARFQRPPLFPNQADYAPSNQLPCRPEQAPCPCCPIRSNWFPAADFYSPPHQKYLKYLSNQFGEPRPAFMRTRVYSTPRDTTLDDHQRSHDYKTRWVIGIREDEDQE